MANEGVDERATATEYSVLAIVAAALGIASAFLTGTPLLATALAIGAIAVALYSRRQLKTNPAMRGFAISLIGFLTGIWVVATTAVPYLFSAALVMSS
ncbi:hypothetical protein [Mycetocola zhujimingii]|uniref:hypothetical protein n=1 Tax=Mycetocola zhujimingii TaxID=2079792 RepID=UPI000D3BA94E|nr:hypothetical protein [Mycetocola zhujimingii]AWB85877.1 hypothetical protein C3E77_04110 [Mycetocola zhujimingii]